MLYCDLVKLLITKSKMINTHQTNDIIFIKKLGLNEVNNINTVSIYKVLWEIDIPFELYCFFS